MIILNNFLPTNTHGFGNVPDPPEEPECVGKYDEEMCKGCEAFDECWGREDMEDEE